MPLSDTALVARCQNNDIAAFDEIVARYKNKIFSYIVRMIGSTDDAEDLTQEVFVKMYMSLDGFRSQSSLNTWLYRIAGNLCIDRHRKRTRRQAAMGGPVASLDDSGGFDADAVDDKGASRDVPDQTQEPFKVLAQQELDEQIQLALKQIPEKMRSVVVLHDIEGLAYEEIAQVIGCPLGTVKSRLFNARMQLRDLLRPYIQS